MDFTIEGLQQLVWDDVAEQLGERLALWPESRGGKQVHRTNGEIHFGFQDAGFREVTVVGELDETAFRYRVYRGDRPNQFTRVSSWTGKLKDCQFVFEQMLPLRPGSEA